MRQGSGVAKGEVMYSVGSKCERWAEKLSQTEKAAYKDPQEGVGSYWLDVVEKSTQTEKEHTQWQAGERFLLPLCCCPNSGNVELPKGLKCWPLVQRGAGYPNIRVLLCSKSL